jgi:hypothetical protein
MPTVDNSKDNFYVFRAVHPKESWTQQQKLDWLSIIEFVRLVQIIFSIVTVPKRVVQNSTKTLLVKQLTINRYSQSRIPSA